MWFEREHGRTNSGRVRKHQNFRKYVVVEKEYQGTSARWVVNQDEINRRY